MIALLKDPLLYLNYGIAILVIYLIKKFGPDLEKDIYSQKHWMFVFRFGLLAVTVGTCIYLTEKLGDMSLIKLGLKP